MARREMRLMPVSLSGNNSGNHNNSNASNNGANGAEQIIAKVRELPRRSGTGQSGFDAIGVVAAQRPCRVPRQQSFYLPMLRLRFRPQAALDDVVDLLGAKGRAQVIDADFLPMLEQIRGELKSVKQIVVMADGQSLPNQ